jgi:hypothetical protein
MNGYIFLCDEQTEGECLDRLLFGTSHGGYYNKYFQNIEIGDWVFLYNYKLGLIRGPFKAVTKCAKKIVPEAWDKKYPFQVRVDSTTEYNEPLTADEIATVLSFHENPKFGLLPQAAVSDQTLVDLIGKMRNKNEDETAIEAGLIQERKLSSSYVFCCDRNTGGRCFADNIMGGPVTSFRRIVGRVRPGDLIFLWQMEERRIYGIWRAAERGRYDPTEFEGKFPAVVRCERVAALETGIGETEFFSIVPLKDKPPPYSISYEQHQKLAEALLTANKVSQYKAVERGDAGKYRTEDGHWVRSQGEIIIDNWLFMRQLLHAYEYRLQVGNRHLY